MAKSFIAVQHEAEIIYQFMKKLYHMKFKTRTQRQYHYQSHTKLPLWWKNFSNPPKPFEMKLEKNEINALLISKLSNRK